MSKKKNKEQIFLQENNYLQKDLEYYKTLLTLWVENRMTSVKTVLNLSVGGIGLLVTFSHYFKVSYESFIFVVISIACFCFSILCCLGMYYLNPEYLENELALENYKDDEDCKELEKVRKKLGAQLDFLHKGSFIFLVLAVLFFSIMGSMQFLQNCEKNMKEKKMSSTKKNSTEKTQVIKPASDSVALNAEGITKMRPNPSISSSIKLKTPKGEKNNDK